MKKFAQTQIVPTIKPAVLRHVGDSAREGTLRDVLDDCIEKHMVKHVFEAVLFVLRSGEVEEATRGSVRAAVEQLVAAEMAKRADEIETRVKALVDEQFEKVVAATARQLLEAELERVKGKFA